MKLIAGKKNLFNINQPQWLAGAILFYILLFSAISLMKYYQFGYNALDLAIINQVFYNSALGQWFGSSIHPPTYLGDHFSPIIFLLLPFYLLGKNPQTLLIGQSIILGLSAWPVYLIARNILSKNWSLVMALAWLLNPVVQNTNLFEVSFLPAAIFFLLWTFYFYQRQNFAGFLVFTALALLVREDVSLAVLMFGVLAGLQKRSWRWVIAPMVLGLGYFIGALIITKLFAPAQSYKFFIYYPWLNKLLTEPWLPIFYLFRINNLIYLLGLFLTLVFVPLLGPLYLLPGLLVLAQLILGSGGGSQTLLETHYSSLLLPALFTAGIYGWQKIITNRPGKLINLISQHRQLLIIIFVIGVIYSSLTLGPLVGAWLKLKQPADLTAQQKILASIPNDASVAASYSLLASLSSRTGIYSLNYVFLGKQQFLSRDYALPEATKFLAVDFNDLITYNVQYGRNPYYQSQYQQALTNWPKVLTGFGLTAIEDGVALFQRGANDNYQLLKFLDQPPGLEQKPITLNEQITFLGYQKNNQTHELFWQLVLPLSKSYQLKLEVRDSEQIIYEQFYPLAYDLLIGATPGTPTVQTNYWFSLDKKLPPGTYHLKINLVEITEGGIDINALRGTETVVNKELIVGTILDNQITLPPDKL